MSRFIVKLEDKDQTWYLEWSTVVDAPVTSGMSLDEFRKYYRDEYGRSSMEDFERRLERVAEKGTSAHLYSSAEDTIECNRAGVGGTVLSRQQIIDYYCTQTITDRPVGTPIDKTGRL